MQPLDEDWKLLLGLLPTQWQQQAVLSGACERLRGFSSTSSLLRTLLLHVGKGYSLRETVVRAKAAGRIESLRRAHGGRNGLRTAIAASGLYKKQEHFPLPGRSRTMDGQRQERQASKIGRAHV